MNREDVQVGGEYRATISGNRVTVRIEEDLGTVTGLRAGKRIKIHGGWSATNTVTNKRIRIKTAQKLTKITGKTVPTDSLSGGKPSPTTSDVNPNQFVPGARKVGGDAVSALDGVIGDKIGVLKEDCKDAKAPKIEPTDEQKAGLAIVRKGAGVTIMEAGAGCGKSSFLVMAAGVLKGYGQYTAFNTALVAESKEKFIGTRVSCNTTHSLAFRAIGKKYSHRLGKNRVKTYQVAKMLDIRQITVEVGDGKKTLTPDFLASQVLGAIKRFCQSADKAIECKHFKYIDGIDMPVGGQRTRKNNQLVQGRLLRHAWDAWFDIAKPDGNLPFSHDCYVKLWQLSDNPVISGDYILLDEGQDTAPVMLDIIERQTCPIIVVGDSCQQIYEWRSAVNALAHFKDAPQLWLTQSFRFGKAIADVANLVLETLDEPTKLRLRGFEKIDSKITVIDNPTAILCRTNATAVSKVLEIIAQGKKPFLIGGGAEVIAFVEGAKELQAGRPTGHPELACFDSWKEVQEYSKLEDGEDLKLMVKIIDSFGVDVILKALKSIGEEKDADVIISTAHKSKGREYKRVKVASDFPPVGKCDDGDKRLMYVTVTRAQEELDVSECPFFSSRDGLGVVCTPSTTVTPQPPPVIPESAEDQIIPPPAPPLSPPKIAPTGFTWRRSRTDDAWLVHGPSGCMGQVVEVQRQNGPVARRRLVSIEKEFSDATLYRVQ